MTMVGSTIDSVQIPTPLFAMFANDGFDHCSLLWQQNDCRFDHLATTPIREPRLRHLVPAMPLGPAAIIAWHPGSIARPSQKECNWVVLQPDTPCEMSGSVRTRCSLFSATGASRTVAFVFYLVNREPVSFRTDRLVRQLKMRRPAPGGLRHSANKISLPSSLRSTKSPFLLAAGRKPSGPTRQSSKHRHRDKMLCRSSVTSFLNPAYETRANHLCFGTTPDPHSPTSPINADRSSSVGLDFGINIVPPISSALLPGPKASSPPRCRSCPACFDRGRYGFRL